MEQDFHIDTYCLPNTPKCTINLYNKIINDARNDFSDLTIDFISQDHTVSFTRKIYDNTFTLTNSNANKHEQAIIKEFEGLKGIDASNKVLMNYLNEEVAFLDIKTLKCSQFKNILFEVTSTRMFENKLTEIFHVIIDTQGLVQTRGLEVKKIEYTQGLNVLPLNIALEALVLFIGKSNIVAYDPTLTKTLILSGDEGCCLNSNLWMSLIELTKICFPYLKSHDFNDLTASLTGTLLSDKAIDNIISLSNIYLASLHALSKMDKDLIDILSSVCKTDQWSLVYLFKKLYTLQTESNQSDFKLIPYDHDKDVISAFFKKNRRKMVNLYDANMMSKTIACSHAEKSLDISPSEVGVHKFLEFSGDQKEYRTSQEEMSDSVYKALNTSNNLLIEAGTGTGKTFAYLIPAIEYSLKNNKQVAISTVTNSLLDQIVYKDLPVVERAFKKVSQAKVSYVPLKGASHYMCLRDTEKLVKRIIAQKEIGGYTQADFCNIAMAMTQIWQNDFTDISCLAFLKDSAVPYKIKADTKYCRRQHCSYFPNLCFLHGIKNRAQKANIIITNHSLALRNLKHDTSMFSDIKNWVFDEAHALGKEALEAFSVSFNLWTFDKLLAKLKKDKSNRQLTLRESRIKENLDTLFPNDENNYMENEGGLSEIEKIFKATCTGPDNECSDVFGDLKNAIAKFTASANLICQIAPDFRIAYQAQSDLANISQLELYKAQELWINDDIKETVEYCEIRKHSEIVVDLLNKMTSNLLHVFNQIQIDLTIFEEILLPKDIKNLSKLSVLCENIILVSSEMAQSLSEIYLSPKKEYTQELHFKKIGNLVATVALSRALNTADDFRSYVYKGANSIILTSATLSYNKSFKYLEKQLGVICVDDFPVSKMISVGSTKIIDFSSIKNKGEAEENVIAVGRMLAPVFDYDSRMQIYIPNDMPIPTFNGYLDSLTKLIIDLHIANRGSILTLFTNKAEMLQVYQSVEAILKHSGINIICHTGGPITSRIKEDFINNKSTSLFGLKSLWEGFDAPGDTLSGVIICKIPFASGHDPRSLMLKQMKRDSFNSILMPDAVIQLKQAAGRLLRKTTDRGFVVIADSRICSKNYGKRILNSLPSKDIKIIPSTDIVEEIVSRETSGGE